MTEQFSDSELERYSRQFVLPEWSAAAQSALRDASVMVIGLGALGSPVATYLAAAGVGRIGLVDGDVVELSNLHRQPLHFTPDIGVGKADSAAHKLAFLNPEIELVPYPAHLDENNAAAILTGASCVVDCTDNLRTRFVLNQACVDAGVPLVEAGVLGFAGIVQTIIPGQSACYRCAFPLADTQEAAPTCRDAGIVGAIAGVVGSIQALEAIKLITGIGQTLVNTVLSIDGRDMSIRRVAVARLDDCTACGSGRVAATEATV